MPSIQAKGAHLVIYEHVRLFYLFTLLYESLQLTIEIFLTINYHNSFCIWSNQLPLKTISFYRLINSFTFDSINACSYCPLSTTCTFHNTFQCRSTEYRAITTIYHCHNTVSSILVCYINIPNKWNHSTINRIPHDKLIKQLDTCIMLFLRSRITDGTSICTKLAQKNRDAFICKLVLHLLKLKS